MSETGTNQDKISRRFKELARVDDQIADLTVRRAGLMAEVEVLRRGAPAVTERGGALSLTEQILGRVESCEGAISVQAVAAHLVANGVSADSNRVSAILGRNAGPGGRVRRVRRGLFEAAGVAT